jgi:hypothetical protein
MPNMIRYVLMAILLLAIPGLARAHPVDNDPLIELTPLQAASFASAFTTLSQQAHIAIVAEDQPLYPTLIPSAFSSPTRPNVASLNLKKEGEPLSVLLLKMAAAYDYDVVPFGKVFLLKKRYTDAADLPSITVKECELGLEEMNRYAEPFNPNYPYGELFGSHEFKDLVYSLTPEQLQAMDDLKQGVPVSSLAPEQQQEVWHFLLHCWIQRSVNNLPEMIGAINRVAAADPQFSWADCAKFNPLFARDYAQSNIRLFGYDAALAGGQSIFVTLSKPDQIKVEIDGSIRVTTRQDTGAMQVKGQFAQGDMTDPTPLPANAPKPAPPISLSLKDIVTHLNAQAPDGLKITVESYLAPKQASVFGEAVVSPREELNALAEIYGLRVLTEEKVGGKDRLRLTRQTAQVPLDVIALHDSLLNSLPDPLVRACRMHPTFGTFNTASPLPSGISPLLIYAVKQLRTAAEPKIKASKNGRVALSMLSEREGRAFAMTVMVDAMDALCALTTADVPKEVTQFNELRLGGGLSGSKTNQKMSIRLELPDPTAPGTLRAGLGVGEISYDPVNQTL